MVCRFVSPWTLSRANTSVVTHPNRRWMDHLFRLSWLVLFVVVPFLALRGAWRDRLKLVHADRAAGDRRLMLFNWATALGAERIFLHLASYSSQYSPGHATTEISEAIVESLIGAAAFVAWRRARRGELG